MKKHKWVIEYSWENKCQHLHALPTLMTYPISDEWFIIDIQDDEEQALAIGDAFEDLVRRGIIPKPRHIKSENHQTIRKHLEVVRVSTN